MIQKKSIYVVLIFIGLLLASNVKFMQGAVIQVSGEPPTVLSVYIQGAEDDTGSAITSAVISDPSVAVDGMPWLYFDANKEQPTSATLHVTGENYDETWTTTHFTTSNGFTVGHTYFDQIKALVLSQNTLYTFEVTATDAQGDQVVLKLYGKTEPEAPAGQFYINDVEISPDTVLTITSRTVQVDYKNVKNGVNVKSVRIDVSGTSNPEQIYLTETLVDSEWSTSYTFPRDGDYTVNGTVTWSKGDILVMSIQSQEVGASLFTSQQLSGFALMALGVIGWIREKE